MLYGAAHQFEQQVGERLNARKAPAFEQGIVFGGHDDQAVLEQEHTHRGNTKHKMVVHAVIARALENERGVLRFELDARQLVGVQRRVQGVLVELILLDQVLFFLLIRTYVDEYVALAAIAILGQPSVIQVILLEHRPRNPHPLGSWGEPRTHTGSVIDIANCCGSARASRRIVPDRVASLNQKAMACVLPKTQKSARIRPQFAAGR